MIKVLILAISLVAVTLSSPLTNDVIASAQLGNAAAQEELGEHYFKEAEGYSYKQNITKHQGSKEKFNNDIESNKSEALRWLHAAARNGSKRAFYYLGSYFNVCCWGEENVDSAFYYWSEGSKRGEKYSQKKLAYLYLNGIGCEKDIIKAHILSWKSFFHGNISTPLMWIAKWLDIDTYVS